MKSLNAVSYYTLLGVTRDASLGEIERAFKMKSQQHHPDKGGDAAIQAEIGRAYSCLSNAERRQQYDRTGVDNVKTIDAEVRETIIALFRTVISQDPPNYLAAAIAYIRKQLEECVKNHREISQHRKKLIRKRSKIKVKPGAINLFLSIMEQSLTEFDMSLEELKEQEKIFRATLKELNNYESDEDIPDLSDMRASPELFFRTNYSGNFDEE